MTALGRWGQEAEVEGLAQFIASDAGSYLTGTNFVSRAGLSIMLRSAPVPESPVTSQWL